MTTRRDFLKSAAAIPLAQDGTSPAPKKKYHVTLWSGGSAVKEWDVDNWSGGDGGCYFSDSTGKSMVISGTYSMEEIDQ